MLKLFSTVVTAASSTSLLQRFFSVPTVREQSGGFSRRRTGRSEVGEKERGRSSVGKEDGGKGVRVEEVGVMEDAERAG